MKVVIALLLLFSFTISFSQKKTGNRNKGNKVRAANTNRGNAASGIGVAGNVTEPRQTITEKRLNGPTANRPAANHSGAGTTAEKTPFVGGIHAADNAKKVYDEVEPANPNNINNRNAPNVNLAGGNDTAFNVNTINQGSGVTTNSGAIDRSGQSQFGQTNWGDGRGTIGESQWTIPPPITASFSRDFPTISNATWSRSNTDTSIYAARYRSGAEWVTANYNASGARIDTRTELGILQPPRPVSVYLAKQPQGFQPMMINRIQVQGRADIYEIQTRGGKTVYVNNDGVEVNY